TIVQCRTSGPKIRPTIRIDSPPRLSGDGAEAAARLPISKNLGYHTATVRPLLVLATRQFVNVRNLKDLRCVEACRSTVSLQNIGIVPIETGPTVVIRPIYSFGISVSSLDHQPMRELAIDGHLKRMIVGAQPTLEEKRVRSATK